MLLVGWWQKIMTADVGKPRPRSCNVHRPIGGAALALLKKSGARVRFGGRGIRVFAGSRVFFFAFSGNFG